MIETQADLIFWTIYVILGLMIVIPIFISICKEEGLQDIASEGLFVAILIYLIIFIFSVILWPIFAFVIVKAICQTVDEKTKEWAKAKLENKEQ